MSATGSLTPRLAALERQVAALAGRAAGGEALQSPPGILLGPDGQVKQIYLVQSETPFLPVGPIPTAEVINQAITDIASSSPHSGGTIILPPGDFLMDEPINANNTYNVTLLGAGSAYGGTRLKMTIDNDLVDARSSGGFAMQGIALWNENPAFSHALLNLASLPAGGNQGTGLFRVDNCNFTAQAGATGYGALLQNALGGTIEKSYFIGGGTGIRGMLVPGDFCNANQIGECFFQGQISVAIADLGIACGVTGCTFEPLANGNAGAYFQDSNLPAAALQWLNNYMGDVGNSTGSWMVVHGVGHEIAGNLFSGGNTGIQTNGNCAGLQVTGNTFGYAASMTNAIDTTSGAHGSIVYLGNDDANVAIAVPFTTNWGLGSIVHRALDVDSVSNAVAAFGDTTQVRCGNVGGSAPIIYFGTAEDTSVFRSGIGALATNGFLKWGVSGTGCLQNGNAAAESAGASAGTNGAPPAQVAGYLLFQDHTGADKMIPYYNP